MDLPAQLTNHYITEGFAMIFSFISSGISQNICVIAYMLLIVTISLVYRKIVKVMNPSTMDDMQELTQDIVFSLVVLLLAPIVYFVLSFFGLNVKYMINDPLPFIMFLGGLSSFYDLIKAKKKFKMAPNPVKNDMYLRKFKEFSNVLYASIFVSWFSVLYGLVMIVFTNLSSNEGLKGMLWFVTFLLTAYPIILTSLSKVLIYISQEYKNGEMFKRFSGKPVGK